MLTTRPGAASARMSGPYTSLTTSCTRIMRLASRYSCDVPALAWQHQHQQRRWSGSLLSKRSALRQAVQAAVQASNKDIETFTVTTPLYYVNAGRIFKSMNSPD